MATSRFVLITSLLVHSMTLPTQTIQIKASFSPRETHRTFSEGSRAELEHCVGEEQIYVTREENDNAKIFWKEILFNGYELDVQYLIQLGVGIILTTSTGNGTCAKVVIQHGSANDSAKYCWQDSQSETCLVVSFTSNIHSNTSSRSNSRQTYKNFDLSEENSANSNHNKIILWATVILATLKFAQLFLMTGLNDEV